MGTSGAYGGSAGWSGTRRDTNAWLGNKPNPAGADVGGGDQAPTEQPQLETPVGAPPIAPANPDLLLVRVLGGVTRHLSDGLRGSSTGGGAPTGGGGTGGGGGGGGGGGTTGGRRRAATSGGLAIAGAHGLRSRDADAVADAGLALVDLEAMGPFEQARRIVDAASGRSALVEESELREVNANFVWWAIQQDSPPTPEELVKEWVTEYVFRAWLTEAGAQLRDGSRDGASTHALEREARVTLEAAVSRAEFPVNGIRASHFEAAIGTLLGMLGRIFRVNR